MLFQCIQLINFFRGEPKHTIKQGPDGQLFWLFYVFGVLYFGIRVIKKQTGGKLFLTILPNDFSLTLLMKPIYCRFVFFKLIEFLLSRNYKIIFIILICIILIIDIVTFFRKR